MRKLRQAATLIKDWALETKHRVRGEHMLMAIHSEPYDAGLDDQASAVVFELEALRNAPYETKPPRELEDAVTQVELARLDDPVPGGRAYRQ